MDMLRRLISCRIISIIITAAGLLQCSVGWHSTTPCTALAIGDERGRTTRLRVIKVRSPHAAPRQLHWLKVPWRIDYKLAVLVYKCLHGLAPSYLADELHHPAESEFRRRLSAFRSLRLMNCLFPIPDSQTTATELFQSPLYESGTFFRSTSRLLRHFPSSALA